MIEIRATGIDEAIKRMKRGELAVRNAAAIEMRRGAEDFIAAARPKIRGHLKGSATWAGERHPTGRLENSGVAWSKTAPWGVIVGASWNATADDGSRYAYILQAGVDTTREPPMWKRGGGRNQRRRQRKAYARKNFKIKAMPFVAETIATHGPTITKRIERGIIAAFEGATDGR